MNRSDLVKLLELVSPALSDTDVVQIFTHFMFRNEEISASNDALCIIAKSKSIITEDDPFALQGVPLIGLLKNTIADNVTFKLGKENECIVEAGRSIFKLPFLTEEEFLFEEPTKEKWEIKIRIEPSLLKGIKACLVTASRDMAAPAIMGVAFKLGKGLQLYSCDGDAVTRFNFTGFGEGSGTFTVPVAFCEALLRIYSESEPSSGELKINGLWATATLSSEDKDFTLYGRMLVNDEPLDHADLIDKTLTGKTDFVDIPTGLWDALSRARIVADHESKPTRLTIKGSKLNLLTEASLGIVKDELAIKGHPAVDAAVHASLMQRAIDSSDLAPNKIAIRENCTVYKLDDILLQVVSNVE